MSKKTKEWLEQSIRDKTELLKEIEENIELEADESKRMKMYETKETLERTLEKNKLKLKNKAIEKTDIYKHKAFEIVAEENKWIRIDEHISATCIIDNWLIVGTKRNDDMNDALEFKECKSILYLFDMNKIGNKKNCNKIETMNGDIIKIRESNNRLFILFGNGSIFKAEIQDKRIKLHKKLELEKQIDFDVDEKIMISTDARNIYKMDLSDELMTKTTATVFMRDVLLDKIGDAYSVDFEGRLYKISSKMNQVPLSEYNLANFGVKYYSNEHVFISEKRNLPEPDVLKIDRSSKIIAIEYFALTGAEVYALVFGVKGVEKIKYCKIRNGDNSRCHIVELFKRDGEIIAALNNGIICKLE
ncbi:hypothetical protein ECANGB1_1488 [Enterospora canceri]|uniref:Uncharacterized protein n=1 Tax=Enterospora canceri TaxID=1081671 RepID=A0A1Y1S744_9MICR|nr:hypothetical protein ECANGB1_1488 [Enterospora canceri]